METIVYKFGLLRPVENAHLVAEQMKLAHDYRNMLTHLERARRAAVREILAEHDEVKKIDVQLAEAKKTLEALLVEVSTHKAAKRSRQISAELRQAVTEAKATVRALRQQRFTAVRTAREATADQIEAVQERHDMLHKAARAESGVYWGTYLLVEDAMHAVRKSPLHDGFGEPNDPHYLRAKWPLRGMPNEIAEGQIGVQIPHGILPAALATDPRVRITDRPLGPNADPKSRRSTVTNVRKYLHLRVGSSGPGNREPVWAVFPMIMSRPLPEDASIKRVSVKKRLVGPCKEEWSVQLTVQLAEPKHRRRGRGTVAVDLGWRQEEAGIRVGTWIGEVFPEGAPAGIVPGFIHCPPAVEARLAKARSIRSIRDRDFLLVRDALAAWFGGPRVAFVGQGLSVANIDHWRKNFPEPHVRPASREESPATMLERAASLSQWKSAERLHRLVEFWGEHRFPGDIRAYSIAEAWRYHDRHLWAWEANETKSTIRFRTDCYRKAAAELAARFETLVLEDLDLRELAETPAPETGEANDTSTWRQIASPSDLRAALINAFGKERVVLVPAANTTRVCSKCGHENDVGAALRFTCASCGTRWDQDLNACHNLLRWQAQAVQKERKVHGRGGRWAEAKREKAARQESRQEAGERGPAAP